MIKHLLCYKKRVPHPPRAPSPHFAHERANLLRLNLGCGTRPIAGFTNVDALPLAGVDTVADLAERLPFSDASADLIYASHVLEHFPTLVVPTILADWRRVLADNGRLFLAVPNIDVIAAYLVSHPGWFTPPHNPWLGAIYGGQKDAYDFHKTGFNLPWLVWLLNVAGFGQVKQVEAFSELGMPDLSRAELPFGRNVSLNVIAIAGAATPSMTATQRSALEYVFGAVDRVLSLALRASVLLRSRLMARRRRRIERAVEGTNP